MSSLTFLASLVILPPLNFFTACMIAPRKSLGQNFLRDENVARKIVDALDLHRDEIVVEIGPGTGALTKYLTKATATAVGIEVDKRAAAVLRSSFGDGVDIIVADVLQVDLHLLASKYRKPLRVVGNIPYYITSEILFRLFDSRTAVQDATLMMQLEVAQRLIAKPKSKHYGILSVSTQFYTEPEILFKVSRNSFYPKPKVDSAVVRFAFKKELPSCNIPLFTNIVRSTFGKRRKTLRNGLRYMGFSDEQLNALRFDIKRRPEELSVAGFLELTAQLEQYKDFVTSRFHA